MRLKPYTKRSSRCTGRLILSAAMALSLTAAANTAGYAQPNSLSPVTVDDNGSTYAGYVTVPLDKSRILRVSSPVKQLMVGNSSVADVLALTDRSVYVLGKEVGSTSLSIYGSGKRLIAVIDLRVSHDTRGLKRDLFELMPDQAVEVRAANDAIVLAGSVTTAQDASRASRLAERYAPGKVSNFLSVQESQQVMLSVRFAEVKRTAAKALGLKTDVDWSSDTETLDFASGFLNPDAFGHLMGNFIVGDSNVKLIIDALEEKGIVTTLAEPTLIAISGETASFLAGGEFPVPVAQDSGDNNTVEFKDYGVALAFTPTVLGDTISLKVAPEVSTPDYSMTTPEQPVPGVTTRRAQTTVEMRNGQSFAIAGLLQSDFSDSASQLPGIGNIPILGALTRSSQFSRQETELVIIITPYLVQPVDADKLSAPTDYVVRPYDLELYMAGFTESGPLSGNEPEGLTYSDRQGGLDGRLGYVID